MPSPGWVPYRDWLGSRWSESIFLRWYAACSIIQFIFNPSPCIQWDFRLYNELLFCGKLYGCYPKAGSYDILVPLYVERIRDCIIVPRVRKPTTLNSNIANPPSSARICPTPPYGSDVVHGESHCMTHLTIMMSKLSVLLPVISDLNPETPRTSQPLWDRMSSSEPWEKK